MVKKIDKNLLNENGFLILESLVALLLGSVIAMTFIFSSTNDLSKSERLRKDILLKNIAQEKINMLIENTPELTDSLTLNPKEEDFEYKEKDGSDRYEKKYKTRVIYKRLEIPDISKIQGEETEEEKDQYSKKIMENITKNLKEIIWQARVEVWDPDSPDDILSLSTYLYNDKAIVKIEAI